MYLCVDEVEGLVSRDAILTIDSRVRVAYACIPFLDYGVERGNDSHSLALCVLSRVCFVLGRAEERCRKELSRENIVVEISVVTFFPKLFGWYEAQGYKRTRTIPFPLPELVREGYEFELQLMTKTI